MAYVDLDKIINVSGWGGSVYPGGDDPAPYPVLSQSIGIFNKPDARDGDSNGRFGLLNNSNNTVNAQNNNWNTQMAVAVDSGVWALSTHVKSFDFSTTIAQIDSGQIKYTAFSNITNNVSYYTEIEWQYVYMNFDLVTKEWINVIGNDFDLWASISSKWFVVLSWLNNYLVVLSWYTLKVYPCTADGVVTWNITSSYDVWAWLPQSDDLSQYWGWHASIVWANEETVFVSIIRWSTWDGQLRADMRSFWDIYNISSSWIISRNVRTQLKYINLWTGSAAWWWGWWWSWWIASYQIWNISYVYWFATYSASTWQDSVFWEIWHLYSFDLTNKVVVTVSDINYRTSNTSTIEPKLVGSVNGYWDSLNSEFYTIWNDLNIYKISSLSVTDTWNDYYLSSNRYRSVYSKYEKLYTQSDNIWFNNNMLMIWWTNINWTFTSLYLNSINIIKPDGVSEEDDMIKYSWIWTTYQYKWQDMLDEYLWMLRINGVDVPNSWSLLFPAQVWNRINALPTLTQSHTKSIDLPLTLIWQPYLNIELYNDNDRWFPIKLTLWSTGGNYTTPTLPANNGMTSGSATTPRVPGTDASYINLTLAS